QMLEKITGYSAISLQPNAGSQGEYSGLLAIDAFHKSNGHHNRKVCLITGDSRRLVKNRKSI
ncbi:hypothetical protein, partial [Marivivens sp.]|uniref:hypothetical protein n=1 Tax=Marivivens sp. TaxID=1978374 RepID=UPI0025BD0540